MLQWQLCPVWVCHFSLSVFEMFVYLRFLVVWLQYLHFIHLSRAFLGSLNLHLSCQLICFHSLFLQVVFLSHSPSLLFPGAQLQLHIHSQNLFSVSFRSVTSRPIFKFTDSSLPSAVKPSRYCISDIVFFSILEFPFVSFFLNMFSFSVLSFPICSLGQCFPLILWDIIITTLKFSSLNSVWSSQN